jgi:hypothetical protein
MYTCIGVYFMDFVMVSFVMKHSISTTLLYEIRITIL